MLQRVTGLLVTIMLCATSASAQEPTAIFDPGKLKGSAKGTPNEVMVLGTAHLAQLPASFPSGRTVDHEFKLANGFQDLRKIRNFTKDHSSHCLIVTL